MEDILLMSMESGLHNQIFCDFFTVVFVTAVAAVATAGIFCPACWAGNEHVFIE
jgi:hypothetical protein